MPFPSSPLHHVSVSPDGKTFCLSDWDRPLEAYDVKSGERLWRSSLRRYRHILCADTHWLTIYEDRMLVQLSADTGEITARIPARMRNTSLFDFSPHFCLLPLRRERWGILRKDTLEIVQELPDAAFPSGILLDAWLRGARPALLRQRRIGEERMLYMDEAEYHLDPAVCADYDAVTEKQRTAFLTDMLRRNYAIQGQIHICP